MSSAAWPQVGVGAIVVKDGQVLLVRRGKPPSLGLWAIPGGKVRAGESLAQATAREILEETGIVVRVKELAWHFDYIEHSDDGDIRYHYVVLDYFADYVSGKPVAGDDAVEAAWVPFERLRDFELNPSTREALSSLFNERGG